MSGVQEKPVSRPHVGLSGLTMNFCAWTLCWNLYEIITAPHGAHQRTGTDYRLVYWLIEFSDVNNDMHCTLKGQHKSSSWSYFVTLLHIMHKPHFLFKKSKASNKHQHLPAPLSSPLSSVHHCICICTVLMPIYLWIMDAGYSFLWADVCSSNS